MSYVDTIKHVMGAGSLAVGAAGIVKPATLARMTGATAEEARGLGFRDLAIGAVIYSSPRLGLAQRALVDLGDAWVFAKRKPAIAALGVGSAAVAAFAATR